MASDDTLTRCTTPYKVHTAASVEKRWGSLFFKGLRLTLTLPAQGRSEPVDTFAIRPRNPLFSEVLWF